MRKSFLDATDRRSPLKDAQLVGGVRKKKNLASELAVALPLTSLIDAFSIIVIYLLVGTQNGGMETLIPTKMSLPSANHSLTIQNEMPILRIEKGRYFLNDESVSVSRLGDKLSALRKKNAAKELMIQADEQMKYADLDPLLKAGAQAGIEQLKFAVVPPQ